jgi:hypothetical protein
MSPGWNKRLPDMLKAIVWYRLGLQRKPYGEHRGVTNLSDCSQGLRSIRSAMSSRRVSIAN